MVFKVLWTFSIYLEAVAILPQLVMLQNSGNVDNLTGHYVFFLGCVVQFFAHRLAPVKAAIVIIAAAVFARELLSLTLHHRAYRALYLLNWIYRYFHEPGYRHWIVWISGTVQTIFYLDFFYYYIKVR